MSSKDIKIILKTALSLFLICAVATGLLAFINSVTAPIISANNTKAADEARIELLPSASAFTEERTEDGTVYHKGTKENITVGYVFITNASGYGGTIEVMTAVNADGTVSGISILSINETPGLGMNAKRESFSSQYNGKTGPFSVVKNSVSSENDILAITSATITSDAVTKAVNEALGIYSTVKEG